MKEKKQYMVTIEEMISQTFVITAEDDNEAETIATEKYERGEFVLNPCNLVTKQMEIHNLTDDYYIDWIEF